jgi:molybdopterin-binding protein
MKLSARNVIKGTVKSIESGAVNDEIVIEIAPGVEITSIVTKKSAESMGLTVGGPAYAIIKASSVMLGAE